MYSTTIQETFQTLHCKCKKPANLLVSRNARNKSVGRLYYNCWDCNFFMWWDTVLVDRYAPCAGSSSQARGGRSEGTGFQASTTHLSGSCNLSGVAHEGENTQVVSSAVPELGNIVREEMKVMRNELKEEMKDWAMRMAIYAAIIMVVMYYLLR